MPVCKQCCWKSSHDLVNGQEWISSWYLEKLAAEQDNTSTTRYASSLFVGKLIVYLIQRQMISIDKPLKSIS